ASADEPERPRAARAGRRSRASLGSRPLMATYFRQRGLPVPTVLELSPLTDWRRLGTIAIAVLVIAIALRITDIDTSRANLGYALGILVQLFQFDFSILTPQTEFDTFWDTATGLMIVTIFLGIIATAFAIVFAVPLSFLGARNIMTGNPITAALYALVRLLFTVIRSIDVLI